jgi:aspartokinase
METIAVYWEPKIRVYGLTTKAGLALYTLTIATDHLPFWSRRIHNLEERIGEFEMVNLQRVPAGNMQIRLVLRQDGAASDAGRLLAAGMEDDGDALLQIITPVDLIYLHGPHFQDRYGIAEAAFSPLHKAGLPILTAGCSGTSVYLVVAGGKSREAATCLSETFVL